MDRGPDSLKLVGSALRKISARWRATTGCRKSRSVKIVSFHLKVDAGDERHGHPRKEESNEPNMEDEAMQEPAAPSTPAGGKKGTTYFQMTPSRLEDAEMVSREV